jgi:D-amino peptidase
MKILFSCDMEGISGIVDWEQVTPGKDEWKRGRKLMVGDVNAAINGAFVGGAEAVTVSDAHWHARTLEIEDIDPRAKLHSGTPSPFSMLQGIDDVPDRQAPNGRALDEQAPEGRRPGYDALVFVGYHAMAGAKKGVLCHTWSDKVLNVWLNDVPVGEIGLNAATAGHYGTPIIAITGDHTACLEAQTLLGQVVEVGVVKLGTGRYAAELMPLNEAREKICEAVARGVTKLKSGQGSKPYRVSSPVHLGVEFKFPHQADSAYLLPGSRRLSGTRLDYTAEDMVVAMRAFRAMDTLARGSE